MKPRSLRAIAACGALLWACACRPVVDTMPLQPSALGFGVTCESPLGAYYLPKTILKVNATVASAGQASFINGTFGTPVRTADRAQPLCLDYLSSVVSDDVVRVERSANGLLKGITSRVTDKTPEIFENLATTGANLAIAAGRGLMLRPGDTIDLEFDPFYWPEMMTAKTALRRFGLCIFVEDYSFSVPDHGPAGKRRAAEHWCSTDRPSEHEHSAVYYASLPVPPDIMNTGILYRPNVTHTVVIMQKADPEGPESWKLLRTVKVEMPNVGPILSVGVERAMFARRETDLLFNQGVLTDVAINKTSELAGFVRIPLSVAKAIVSVPAQILQIRIKDTQNQTALLNAQGKLADTLASIKRDAAVGPSNGDGRSSPIGSFVGSCTNAGGDPEACARMARSR